MIVGFHKEGRSILTWTTIVCAALFTLAFLYAPNWLVLLTGLAVLVVLILFFQFFRVPKRTASTGGDAIICPADGKVVVIEEVFESEFLQEKCQQISIFMSPLNVHINWYPISGEILYSKHHPGKFLVAWHPKSSTENERTTVVVKHQNGSRVLFRQVAGAVARRIVNYAKVGESANQSQEFGFIKFGSRIDVYIPMNLEINVKIGEKVVGSKTILAQYA